MGNEDQQQELRAITLATEKILHLHGSLGLDYPRAAETIFVPDSAPRSRQIPVPTSAPPEWANKKAPKPAKQPNHTPSPGAFADLQQQIRACTACPLHHNRPPLFGSGCLTGTIPLLIIGDPPQVEADTSEVFPGAAGELLTKMVGAINLQMEKLFVTNICKCPGTQATPPQAKEILCCQHFLDQQIKLLNPQIILTMGTIASQTVLNSSNQLAALRGRFHTYHGRPLMPTYHPTLLSQYPTLKKGAWQDLLLIQARLKELGQ